MVAITATNSATPSLQASVSKARLEQARREADQAESNAQRLREQADAAENDVQKSHDRVRDLASRSQQTDPTYKPQTQGNAPEVSLKTQDLLVNAYKTSSSTRTANGNPLKTNSDAAPVMNTQGQATGRIVNVSA